MRSRESKEKSLWEEIEIGLGGGRKFRVLAYLILNPDKAFTKYSLAKATGLRTPSIERRLKTLIELGWVKENEFKPKTYQINSDNRVVKLLMEFFQKLREYEYSR
ncbi:MAG: hypothetical protein QW502_00835 [Candidatus Bathyarchaeia archaeon]|nr:hypothetical protein [Candidatus Bathyarchaeota archaeon]